MFHALDIKLKVYRIYPKEGHIIEEAISVKQYKGLVPKVKSKTFLSHVTLITMPVSSGDTSMVLAGSRI